MRHFSQNWARKLRGGGAKFRAQKWVFWVGIAIFLGSFAAFSFHRFFLAHSILVPASGGILTESLVGATQNLNPLASKRTLFDRDLGSLLFAGLLRYNPATAQIESALGDLRISDDGKSYEIRIKDSARFSNGEKVEIEDVIFTFEQVIQNPNFENEALRSWFEYASLQAIDQKTIAFRLPEKNVFFAGFLTTPILPKSSFESALIEEITDPFFPFNKSPVGAGPFRMRHLVPNPDGSFRVFLERNPYFYAGEPKIEQVVFYVFPNFESLEVGHEWTTMFSQVPSFAQQERLAEKILDVGYYQKREYLLPRWVGIFFNLDRRLPSVLGLRQALFYAIDKEKILEGGLSRTDSIFFFEGVPDWQETDFAQARRILRDSGMPYSDQISGRTFGRGGERVVLKILTSTSPAAYSRMVQNLVRTWESELDLSFEIEILEPELFDAALLARDYDLVFFGQNFSENFDPFSVWHSGATGDANFSNLTNSSVDFLIDEIRFSGSKSDIFALGEKMSEILPAVALATPQYYLLVSGQLFGFGENFGTLRSHADRFLGIENWYFYQKKDWNLERETSKIKGYFEWILSAKDE